jgi:putative ABC transport system permease protein
MTFFFRKLKWLWGRRAKEEELHAEIQFHLEEEADERQAEGLTADEAKWAARRELGNVLLIEESTRETWSILGDGEMRDIWVDIKHAIRMFRRSPGFTVTAVAALALGIAATTAIFSVVNAAILRPLPVRDPDRFVVLMTQSVDQKGKTSSSFAASPVKYAYLKTLPDIFEYVSADGGALMNYTGGDVKEQLAGSRVSADVFNAFGIPILLGRTFTPEEDSPHGPHVVLISQEMWRNRFLSDPHILGKSMQLDGDPYTIIGVVAYHRAWEEWGPAPAIFVPLQLDPNSSDVGNYFTVYTRLKPGVTLQQAQAALRASTPQLRARFPAALGPKDVLTVETFKETLIGDTRSLLWVLLGTVSLVLLIACANVANLLLVRATGRKREIAIRSAIGAGRGRVIRQLLTESLLLSFAGGLVGLALGYSGIRALLAVNTAGMPRVGNNGIALWFDWRLAVFALGISFATGIIFGLFPAFESSRADLNAALKESSGRSGTGLRQNKARSALVLSEVGLAVVLLVGAALLIRTFVALYSVDLGFDTSNVLTMRTLMTGEKYQKTAGLAQAVKDSLERVDALPGILRAASAYWLPLQGGAGLPFNIVGRAPVEGLFTGNAGWSPVSPGFFDVFRIPLKRGRAFTGRDDTNSQPVAIINEAMAKQFWKNGDPLQDRILIGHGIIRGFQDEPARQIVGIAGDVRGPALNVDPRPTVYIPQSQMPDAATAFFVPLVSISWAARTQGDPHRLAGPIEEQLRQVTGLPVAQVRSMDEVISLSTARQRFNMLLMAVFGAMALLLAAIGIYGLMAYSVAQRTREIGIRLALGAEGSQVRNMVVRQGMELVLAGVAIGLAAAWALARLIQAFLFGVKAHDPVVFVAAPVVLTLVAFLAVWLPANRAAKVSPVQSLHDE